MPTSENGATMLLEIAHHVREVRQPDWPNLRIDDLCLDSLFTSVRLNDGSVGVALNYDLEGEGTITVSQVDATRAHLLSQVEGQPLLWEMLTEPSESYAQMALLVAVMSALSAPVLADAHWLSQLGLTAEDGRLPLKAFRGQGATRVTVVGFGGYLEEALNQDWLKKVSCCDFNANNEDFKRKNPYPFQLYEKARDRLEVVYDDGGRTHDLIAEADIVCITASTLCNGTLAGLLPKTSGKVVIVEGPSGGVLPQPLFERGVTHLVYNPVDVDFVNLSQRHSRQRRKGQQITSSGRFIDIILPEQRTVRGSAGRALESQP